MQCMDHKMPRTLKVPTSNTNNTTSSLATNSPIATLAPAGKCEQIQEIKWSVLQDAEQTVILESTQELETTDLPKKPQLLPDIPSTTSLSLEPDTPNVSKSIPDADILEIARKQLQELQDVKYNSIVSKSVTDISKPNLIELDIPTKGPPVASKPYTIPLKYRYFADHEIKQLEEAGIISRSMNDWASPILVIPKKEDQVEIPANKAQLQVSIRANLILD